MKRKKSSASTSSFSKKSEKGGKRKNSGSVVDIAPNHDDIEVDSFKKLVYIFVARDSDMFVFETHLEPKID